MKYSILALLLISNIAQANTIVTKCDDGYVYKIYRDTIIQALDEVGDPQMCGERLKAHIAEIKKLDEIYTNYLQAILSRPLYFGEKE